MKKVNEKRGDFGGKNNHPSIMSITRCLESLRDQITLPKKNKKWKQQLGNEIFFLQFIFIGKFSSMH
jgi:hypothetical protein